jgi:hypothetical protein
MNLQPGNSAITVTGESATSEQQLRLLRRGLTIEYVSLVWMTVEVVGAIVAGVFSGSVALLAFGSDSVIELVARGLESSWGGEQRGRQRRGD